MNEREFLKQINSKQNEFGGYTVKILQELLKEGKSLVIRKKVNIWERFFRRKGVNQIVKDNFQVILDNTPYTQLNKVLTILMENDQTLGIVIDYFDKVIKRYTPNEEDIQEVKIKETSETDKSVFFLKCSQWLPETRSEFLLQCRENLPNAKKVLIDHMDTIIQGGVTIEELKYLKGLSQETDEKLNAKLESQKQEVAREIIGSIFIALTQESEKEIQRSEAEKQQLITDYLPTVMRLIEELLVDQNARMVDIERIGRGGYSRVYQIEEKVLKIGRARETYKIPNHPRILQPLTRTNLIDERHDNTAFGCIEISDMTDRLCENSEQELALERDAEAVEKLYQVYKELRNDGIVWTDVRFSNIGKLRKKNIPKLNGEEMNVDPVAVGMDKEANGRVLEVGEWVIIDTDYIYRQEDEKSIAYSEHSYFREFEKRWQQEQQGKIAEKYHSIEGIEDKGSSTKRYETKKWEISQEEEEL